MTRIEQGIELTPEYPVEEVVDLAVAAEAVGFDTVLSSSHYFNRDPFVTLTRIASKTDSIGLGPGVVNPYDAHPVTLASRAATLQEVSTGRAIFGIGAGDASTLSSLGIERDRPLRRVLETVRVARRLWSGERVEHDGTFSVDDAGLTYAVEPLPVYVGAQGPDMLRMAAVHADGVLFNAAHPRDVEWAAERIAEGLDDRRRDDAFTFLVQASVSIAHDETAAHQTARQAVAFIAGGAPPAVLDRHGIDPAQAAEIRTLVGSGAYHEAFDAVTKPMLDAFAVAGTPATVSARFDEFRDHVDGVIAGTPLGPNRDEAIQLLAEALSGEGA